MNTSQGFHVIIPARYASARLPAKPLADIAGKPMIQHVYERARRSSAKSVVVATDDVRISDICQAFGAAVCMTSPDCHSGTDRIAQASYLMAYSLEEIVVNVQGDQPSVAWENINQVALNLIMRDEADMATLCERINDNEELHQPSLPKVVMDHQGYALYFSRSLIPWNGSPQTINLHLQNYYKHMGLYAYRVKTVQAFEKWPPSELELSESLEQLRFLSQGKKIHIETAQKPVGWEVNTPEDLNKIRDYFSSKPL